jgi:hypothetical protein
MQRLLGAAALALALVAGANAADARRHDDCVYRVKCAGTYCWPVCERRVEPRRRTHRHARRHAKSRADRTASGLPGPLVAKVLELDRACGMRVISTFRPGALVAGTRRVSLHALHEAADIAGGDYACAYARLARWPGGVSTDAAAVHHIHLSWEPGGREWRARFVHHHAGAWARATPRITRHRVSIRRGAEETARRRTNVVSSQSDQGRRSGFRLTLAVVREHHRAAEQNHRHEEQ